MQAAVRSSVLSGAALLTAGAIAVTPIQQLPHIQVQAISHSVSTAAVNLTGNAFDLYGEVLKTSVTNLQSDVKSYLDMGVFPVLRQILTNQVGTMTGLIDALGDSGRAVVTALTQQAPSYIGAALGDLGKANIEGALNNLQLAIVLPIMAAINPLGTLPTALGNLVSQPLQSIINIAKDLPNILLNVGLGVIGPVAGGLGAVGAAVQHVINAVKAGNLGKLATAVIQAPATIVDGILNGGYGPNLGALLGINIPGFNIYGGGLFGGGASLPTGGTISGTLQSLVAIVKSILNDITPTKAAAAAKAAATTATTKAVSDVASVPSTTATTVALSTAATLKATGTTTDKVTDKTPATSSSDATPDAATDTKTETKTETKADTKTDASADATKTGSTGDSTDAKTGSSTNSSSSSSDSSSSSSSSSSDGTKTTTSGRKGRHDGSGKSGSSSSAGSSSSDAGSSTKGTHSKGSHSKGSHSHSGSKSKHHAA